MSKAELAAQLAALQATYNGPTILYAPSRKPDRNPHRKKPSLLDLDYQKALEEAETLVASKA